MRYHLAAIFIAHCFGLSGQVLAIFDTQNKESIPYAHVIYYSGSEIVGGTYSNSQGIAKLDLTDKVDSVEVSCLGYISIIIPIQNLPLEILLEPYHGVLEEVTVSPNFQPKTSFLGFRKARKSQSYWAYKGAQMVTYISNPDGGSKMIKTFHLHIKRWKTDKDAAFRILFFYNNEGVPGKQMDFAPIIHAGSIKGREVAIDLDSLDIVFPPNGLFVGIEWMGCLDEIDTIPDMNGSDNCRLAIISNELPDEEMLQQTYVKNVFRTKHWVDVNDNMLQPMTMIPAFGLEVY